MLHARLTDLHAAHQNLPPAIHTLRVKKPYKIYTENERNLTIVVRTYNVHIMCHRIKFHKKSLERRPRYGNFYIFQDGSRRHVGFLKFYIFNGRKGQEGQSASVCQISSKSLELRPIYGFFFYFSSGRRHLGFSKFEILNVRNEGHP